MFVFLLNIDSKDDQNTHQQLMTVVEAILRNRAYPNDNRRRIIAKQIYNAFLHDKDDMIFYFKEFLEENFDLEECREILDYFEKKRSKFPLI